MVWGQGQVEMTRDSVDILGREVAHFLCLHLLFKASAVGLVALLLCNLGSFLFQKPKCSWQFVPHPTAPRKSSAFLVGFVI